MKKIICLMLAMLVMMSCTLPVFANVSDDTDDNRSPLDCWNANFVNPPENRSELTPDKIRSYVVEKLNYTKGDRMFLVQHSFSLLSGGTKYYQQSYRILMTNDSSASIIYDSKTNTFVLSEGEWVTGTFAIRYNIKDNTTVMALANGYSSNNTWSFPDHSGGNLLLQNDFDVIDKETGESLSVFERSPFIFSMDAVSTDTIRFSVKALLNGTFKMGLGIYNQNTPEPSEAQHIPYSKADNFKMEFDKDNPAYFDFNVHDFRDSCSDKKSFSEKIIVSLYASGNGEFDEQFFLIDLEELFDNLAENGDSLFSKKQDYEKFPDISDYIDTDFPDIRDYVNFDMFDNAETIGDYVVAIFQFLWSCLTGFFRWLWAALRFIFFNFIGLIKWLGACLWTIVKNLGIALYNLVVDIRRLLIYLFKPSSDFFKSEFNSLKSTFNEKFSVITSVSNFWDTFWTNLDNDTNAPVWTFSWKGKELLAVDFSMFSDYRTIIHQIILAIAWVLFLKRVYKSLPSLISSMPNL